MVLDGNIIKERLKETFSGLSQEVVAKKLNMTQGSVSKLLTGKQMPTLETLFNIAEIFSVSVDWIIGLKDDKNRIMIETTTSYSDVVNSLTELIYAEGAEILGDADSDRLIIDIKDPLAKALLIKSMTLLRMDMELYHSWQKNKLNMFDDRELMEEMIWSDDVVSLKVNDNLSENGWIQVHDKARSRRAEYMELFK